MKKQLFQFLATIFASAMILATAAPAFAGNVGQAGTMPTMTVSDAPESVALAAPLEHYTNTVRLGTEYWANEPGVRTADPGDESCVLPSCWWISPNNQERPQDGQTLNLNEDAWLMCSFARGTFLIGGTVTVTFTAVEHHQWIFVMHGNEAGPGDRNVGVTITDFDEGFMTCTNLPEGEMISEDYLLQNVDNGYATQCGAIDHCTSGSLAFFEYPTVSHVHVHQAAPDAEWQWVSGNVAPVEL